MVDPGPVPTTPKNVPVHDVVESVAPASKQHTPIQTSSPDAPRTAPKQTRWPKPRKSRPTHSMNSRALAPSPLPLSRTMLSCMTQYAASAFESLRRAVPKGYKVIEHLNKDEDLRPLRERGDSKS